MFIFYFLMKDLRCWSTNCFILCLKRNVVNVEIDVLFCQVLVQGIRVTAANVGMVLDMVRTGLLVFEQSLYNDINPPTPDTVRPGKILKTEVLGWGTWEKITYKIYKKADTKECRRIHVPLLPRIWNLVKYLHPLPPF